VEKRTVFRGHWLPWLLLAPQLAVTLVFFLWPASQALWQALFVEDAFGLGRRYVGMENLAALLHDDQYRNALHGHGRLQPRGDGAGAGRGAPARGDGGPRRARDADLPHAADLALRGGAGDRGDALVVHVQPVGRDRRLAAGQGGYTWNHQLNGGQALLLVVLAAAWKQVSYNFLFLLAGMQSVPKALIEAGAIDGAGPARRFFTIVLPLISPTLFFLLVVNVVYAFFDTFGVIHAVTAAARGRPRRRWSTRCSATASSGWTSAARRRSRWC
jgi:sn-glycerol 3-phosphate transport system permease protein